MHNILTFEYINIGIIFTYNKLNQIIFNILIMQFIIFIIY